MEEKNLLAENKQPLLDKIDKKIFAFDDNMVNYLSNYKVDEDNPFFRIYDKNFWFQIHL